MNILMTLILLAVVLFIISGTLYSLYRYDKKREEEEEEFLSQFVQGFRFYIIDRDDEFIPKKEYCVLSMGDKRMKCICFDEINKGGYIATVSVSYVISIWRKGNWNKKEEKFGYED